MILTIKNKSALDAWINSRLLLGHDVVAIKGSAPIGATYTDGELIVRPVNIAWRDISSEEVMTIEYYTK